jgi:hypothetical protein
MRLAMGLLLTATVTASLGTAANAGTLGSDDALMPTEQCATTPTFAFSRYLTGTNTNGNAVRIITSSAANDSNGASAGYVTFEPNASGGNFAIGRAHSDGGALFIDNGGVIVATSLPGADGGFTFASTSTAPAPNGRTAMTFTVVYGAPNAAGASAGVHVIHEDAGGETANCTREIPAPK